MTCDELEDLALVAIEGIRAMAPGEQLVAVLIVGASVEDFGGLDTYAVHGTHDDVRSRRILETALESFDRKQQPPAGQA